MASILDIAGYVQDQGEQGRKRGLASLLGKAYNAPREEQKAILGAVASRGEPGMAYDAHKHFESMDDSARERLGQYAAAFDALPDEQKPMAYPSLAKQAQELGIPAPAEWNPAFAPNIQKLAMSLQGGKGGAVPTGFQELHMKALAAGLTPGSPEYQQAMNIALGREGRAATGGFGFELIKGADGRERMARKNPRTGAFEVYDETTGDFSPMGGGGSLNGGQPQAMPSQQPMAGGGNPFAGLLASVPGLQVNSTTRTPEHNAKVGGVPNSYHLTGQAMDIAPPSQQQAPAVRHWAASNDMEVIDEGDHWHLEPRGNVPRAAGSPGLAVSRRPEDEAAAKTNAEEAVKLGFLPRTEAIKADAAVGQALEIERGKVGVEVETKAATKARDAEGTLALLDEAEKLLPNATGGRLGAARDDVLGAFNYSTDGAKATAGLKLIAAELVAKVPRFEGPQSNIDVQFYREAAGDLANDKLPVAQRMAALKVMRRLRQRYAGQQDAPRTSRVNSGSSQRFGGFRILED